MFWGLDAGAWGEQAGTMPNIGPQNVTPGTTAQTITQGYHDGTGSVDGDPNLATGNIRSGVTIFGVSGAWSVVDTSSGDAVAGDILTGKTAWVDGAEVTGTASIPAYPGAVPKTGQTATVPINPAPAGSDGDLELGTAWPNPRFTDHGDGTVTDNLTGLIWLKNAYVANTTRTWAQAFADVAELNASGTMNSNASGDESNGGSHQTDWRLPNVRELQSLIDYGNFGPALPTGHPFTNVQNTWYWSSSTYAGDTGVACLVNLSTGLVNGGGKTFGYLVWPVRGGQ